MKSFITELNSGKGTQEKMPVLFLGHGNPMNAIEENEFVANFRNLGSNLPKPRAILCISAHWETRGTEITAMANPRTIHDFGGFPKELYEVQYPAPGSPELANSISALNTSPPIAPSSSWGLDHGSWSVLKHVYPDADVPVLELSLNTNLSPQEHYNLAKDLKSLRKKGILIVGSGNMVHNLGLVAWQQLNSPYAYDWALEASDIMKNFILNGDDQSLVDFRKQGRSFDLAIPTPEHFLPLLYTLALREEHENIAIFNDQPLAGSLTMTSLQFG